MIRLLWSSLLLFPQGDGRGISDDFSRDNLRDGSRYVEFYDPGFSIVNGRLRASVNPGETTLLNILPAFGRTASFSVDARWEVADSSPTIRDADPLPTIVIDGEGADWSSVGAAAEDPMEQGVGEADLKAFRYVGDPDRRVLYVRMDYWHLLEPDENARFDDFVTIDFDLDGNRDIDYRVNLFFQRGTANAFLTRGSGSAERWDDTQWTELSTARVQTAFGEEGGYGFVEAAIPWDLFEAPARFEVILTGGSRGGVDRFDAPVGSLAMGQLARDRGSFVIRADWRYRISSPWVDVAVSFDENYVGFQNHTENVGTPFLFRDGAWYTFDVERSGDRLVVSVNGEEILRTTLQPKGGVRHSAEDDDMGGFALLLEGDRAFRQTVQFDNLKITGNRSPREYQALIAPFMIDEEEHLYSVIHETGFESWAKGVAEGSIPFLQAAARLYGVPPLSRRLGTVQARGEYFASGYGLNGLGVIEEQGHDGPVAPACHELAHNWQHLYSKVWSTEGSAQFACQAIREAEHKILMTADNLGLKPHLRERFDDTDWGAILLDDDRRVQFVDMPNDEYWQGFWKAGVFTYVISRILGTSGYRELHRKALELGHGMNSEELKRIMEEILERDLTEVFSGWVYPGENRIPIDDIFSDRDGDGLGDLDEQVMGTDSDRADTDGDGYRDRAEIASGFDPLDSNDAPVATIVVDGDGGDWSSVRAAADDPREGAGDGDFKTFRYLGDATNRLLHVRVDYWRPLVTDEAGGIDSHVTLDFDLDDNRDIDYRVNLFFQLGVANAFLTRGSASPGRWDDTQWTRLPADVVQVAFGEEDGSGFVEATVPWDLFEAPDRFDVLVSGGTQSGSDRFDSSPPVSPVMSQAVPRLPRTVWTRRP